MLNTTLSLPAVLPSSPLRLVLTMQSGAALHRLCGDELARGGLFVPHDLQRRIATRVDVVVVVDDARFDLACSVLQVFPAFGTALALVPAAAAAVDALMSHALFVPPTGDDGAFRFERAGAAAAAPAADELRRALAEALDEIPDEISAEQPDETLDDLPGHKRKGAVDVLTDGGVGPGGDEGAVSASTAGGSGALRSSPPSSSSSSSSSSAPSSSPSSGRHQSASTPNKASAATAPAPLPPRS
jgi:hypothetical protein